MDSEWQRQVISGFPDARPCWHVFATNTFVYAHRQIAIMLPTT